MRLRIILLVLCSLLIGCSSSFNPYSEKKEDLNYEIAELALNHVRQFDKFRLIEKPTLTVVERYYDGFMADTIDLRTYKFGFHGKEIDKWKSKRFKDRNIRRKIKIIEDFKKVPKLTLHDSQKAEAYLTLSPPLFSDNGQYAVINLNIFFNTNPSTLTGYTLVYHKIEGDWKLLIVYEPYVS